jgi:hypothetical protein
MLAADEVAVFAQSLAQCADLRLEVLLGDSDARPDPSHQLSFADQPSVGFQQGQQEIERARSQGDGHAVCDQQPPTQQHPESTELERRFWRRTLYPKF